MEAVRFGSDFKNQPRIGERYIQSTAGAVSLKSGKGDLLVQKVNVKRYIAGKKPDWAPEHSSEEESDDEGGDENDVPSDSEQVHVDEIEQELDEEVVTQDHGQRQRVRELEQNDNDDENEEGEVIEPVFNFKPFMTKDEESSGHEDEEIDEVAIERRRQQLRERSKARKEFDNDLLDVEDEEDDDEEEEEESSEYEEDSDSDEESGLRLKPVFVRKNDRVTIQERERLHEENEMTEEKVKKIVEERKKNSTKLVTEIVREELKEVQVEEGENLVITDDENDEEEYESWKVRELKRIKRDKEERESHVREKEEMDKVRNMTEDERRDFLRRNPKIVTNKANKGKYKFLQKYYHRGAFFMDEEEDVYKRDFTGATLEDHFNKTVLPKVMQVKNFGRSGRTKYSHLVDQDTTQADSPWFQESAQSLKFHAKIGGGNKQMFEKPSAKKQ